MIDRILRDNGLTEKEARIYLSALAAGEATVALLARKSRLERPTVYGIVEKMKGKGLLSLAKRRGIQYVSALPPRVLVDRFKRSAGMAEQALPQLLEMAWSSPLKPRIRFHEGMDGLKEILREFAHSQTDTMFFSDYASMPPELLAFIWKEIVPERRKLKSFGRGILPRNAVNAAQQAKDSSRLAEHRLVDFPMAENPLELLLYDDSKTAFLSLVKDEIFGVVLDSRAIYKTLTNVFQLVWNAAGAPQNVLP